MNETQRGLLQAIYDDPDDDAVRLVYADWLEDNGDPDCAEFIHLQIERHKAAPSKLPPLWGSKVTTARETALLQRHSDARETALVQRHSDAWMQEAQPFDSGKWGFSFWRGFLSLAHFQPGVPRRSESGGLEAGSGPGTDEDLGVLTRLPVLQGLHISCNDITNKASETLQQLTNLQVLQLHARGLGEPTIAGLTSLYRLRELAMEIGRVSAKSLAPISKLRELESLSVNYSGACSDASHCFSVRVLRHVVSLCQLRTLKIPLDAGDSAEFRHLADLSELRTLVVKGPVVTDSAIQHLATLRSLRTLQAQPSAITEAGARWLAERLPELTVITSEFIVKSPRQAVRFRRYLAGEWASILIPEDWIVFSNAFASASIIHANENGWEGLGLYCWSSAFVGDPATFTLIASEMPTPLTPQEAFAKWSEPPRRPSTGQRLTRAEAIEGCSSSCDGWETASWDCDKSWFGSIHSRHRIAIATQHCRCVFVESQVPPSRFDSFRGLFRYIAESLSLGDPAKEGIGDVIEVATSEIERAAS